MTYLPTCPALFRCILLAACLILLTALFACVDLGRAPQKAVDFQVTLFSGGDFRLSEEVGRRSVVLNFWFPSCPPCRAEMPDFEQAWLQLQDEDVRFLGLFVPQGFDTEKDARDFVQELGLTYDVATDTGSEITKAYQLTYFPTTIFIDKSGRVFKTEIAALDQDDIARIVVEMSQG